MKNTNLELIVNLVSKLRNFDFSAINMPFVEKQILRHLQSLGATDFDEYFDLINSQPDQMNLLADFLTVNVSKFFRDPLTFEIIAQVILPHIIDGKRNKDYPSLRLWSAGCSHGEEPYSLAILVKEALSKSDLKLRTELFATDVDEKALEKTKHASYGLESVENVRNGLLKKYFIENNDRYEVIPEIREMVHFSRFDLIDKKHHAPVESIFGNFDIICCRNVLIYFQMEFQEIIVENLTRSLAPEGFLVLGESEIAPKKQHRQLSKMSDLCKIYRKTC